MAEINNKPVALIGATLTWGADNVNHLDLESFNFEAGLTDKDFHINNGVPGESYELSKRTSTFSFRAKIGRAAANAGVCTWYNALQASGTGATGAPTDFDLKVLAKMNLLDTVTSEMVITNAIVLSCPVSTSGGFLYVTVNMKCAQDKLEWTTAA